MGESTDSVQRRAHTQPLIVCTSLRSNPGKEPNKYCKNTFACESSLAYHPNFARRRLLML